jgi:hypothetical protein
VKGKRKKPTIVKELLAAVLEGATNGIVSACIKRTTKSRKKK